MQKILTSLTSLLSLQSTVSHAGGGKEVDLHWMRASITALPECHWNAFGSVIVNATDGKLLCTGYNHQVETGDPTEHGEVDAIRNCAKRFHEAGMSEAETMNVWANAWIYTTAEPCPMCGTTILQAGFARCIFATSSPDLYSFGWKEYLVSIRFATLAAAAKLQVGFGQGRPITEVVGGVGADETDPLLNWQFEEGGREKCGKGCRRTGKDCGECLCK